MTRVIIPMMRLAVSRPRWAGEIVFGCDRCACGWATNVINRIIMPRIIYSRLWSASRFQITNPMRLNIPCPCRYTLPQEASPSTWPGFKIIPSASIRSS